MKMPEGILGNPNAGQKALVSFRRCWRSRIVVGAAPTAPCQGGAAPRSAATKFAKAAPTKRFRGADYPSDRATTHAFDTTKCPLTTRTVASYPCQRRRLYPSHHGTPDPITPTTATHRLGAFRCGPPEGPYSFAATRSARLKGIPNLAQSSPLLEQLAIGWGWDRLCF